MHVIDDTPDDFHLLELAIYRFKNINMENVRKSSFASIFMQMLHHFQKDELALKVRFF